jgi:hypothetical protein
VDLGSVTDAEQGVLKGDLVADAKLADLFFTAG